MKNFSQAFTALNSAQREAVETIEGPVLVIAGPGTGKTQLLGMRAATIVQRTDTAPQNILCLTFTESAAIAMQERLIKLMGPEGNKIAVFTFHSFGAEIINQYPEYFYNGARFSPANELLSYELLQDIFKKLPASNPLAKTMNGEFTALRSTQSAISHLKRAGLLPEELVGILDHNQQFCDQAEPLISPLFANRLSKKDFEALQKASGVISDLATQITPPKQAVALAALCATQLQKAVEIAQGSGKTTPLTAWRNSWLEKNARGDFVFKDRRRTKKLRALATIYKLYGTRLTEAELFDFDDMVSMVAHTLETTTELRYAIQEQYLYVMVDEFQDTNGAQNRLLAAIAENPVNEDRPNILAVGDDDQAIYAFQGAQLSNVLAFTQRYRDVKIVTLTDNYRSTASILTHARQVITQGQDRLENVLEHINKELTPHTTGQSRPSLHTLATPETEYQWVARTCRQYIADGTPATDIAIIGRNHKYLTEIVPYLQAAGLHVIYERRNNVLDNPYIKQILTLADTVHALCEQQFDVAESLLPELLSYPFWGLKTKELWQLSLSAYKEHRMWLEVMLEDEGKLRAIGEFLVQTAHTALHEPFDTVLDSMLGTSELQVPHDDTSDAPSHTTASLKEEFTSPFRAYFFSEDRFKNNTATFMNLLGNLRALRLSLQNYRPHTELTLHDFAAFIELHKQSNTPIPYTETALNNQNAIHLMTAHKSKGLEFDTVFIIGCQDDIWGRKARHPASHLSFPHNLPIEPAGSSYDDALRLFFVAMTRAKQRLVLTSHTTATEGKERILAEFLQQQNLTPQTHAVEPPTLAELAPGWQQRWLHAPQATQTDLLKNTLESYKLTITHLTNFLDVTHGGPQAFLLQNLLRFPQATTPNMAYGQAIHAVLQRAHTHLSATGERRPQEDILHDFELQLGKLHLSEDHFNYQLERGSEALQTFMNVRHQSFTPGQKAERDFSNQNVVVGDGVRLAGKIDLMEINTTNKTAIVTDYKTSKSVSSWRAVSDYDKIKLHKYKQQLMLYKLLVEQSRDFSGYTVTKGVIEFIEPNTETGELDLLELTYNNEDLAHFIQLLQRVWYKIMTLDFPDTSAYSPNFSGLLAFERDIMA